MREPLEIIEELHRQTAVEAELMTDFFDCLLGRRLPREIDRRVAGQGPGQEKGHDDDAGDDRQCSREAAQDDHQSPAINPWLSITGYQSLAIRSWPIAGNRVCGGSSSGT